MINTVKLQGNGYLVNDSMTVPNSSGNRHWQAVQQWISEGNTPELEFTQIEIDQKVIQDNNSQITQELAVLDRASIRDIREWIAKQLDAPQMLKDREAQAIAKRSSFL